MAMFFLLGQWVVPFVDSQVALPLRCCVTFSELLGFSVLWAGHWQNAANTNNHFQD